jgi:uncharacterized membrane protein
MHNLRKRAPDCLAVLFGVSGAIHILRPSVYTPLIPGWIPNPRAVVYVSGAAELLCAGSLAARTRWARAASALLLIAVFPGNIQMAVNSVHDSQGGLTRSEVLAFLRLPLQLPLIWAALQSSGSERPRDFLHRQGKEAPRQNPKSPMSRDITNERATGIEPAFSAWEADVLPLNYARLSSNRGRKAESLYRAVHHDSL